ncbi:MAG: peptidylprolyl isomerase [Candidatus Carbobacillus altaicus]|nr:peptidylprolyl isomerase [Candidatus Carbobacillus altaicus]
MSNKSITKGGKAFKKSFLLLTVFLLVILSACSSRSAEKGVNDAADPTEPSAQSSPAEHMKKISLDVPAQDVVAKYQGGEITAGTFEQYLNFLQLISPGNPGFSDPASWSDIIDSLIAVRVLADRGEEQGYSEKSDEIDQQYSDIMKSLEALLGDAEAVQKKVEELGLNEQSIKSFLRTYALVDQYLAHTKSDDELKQMYEKEKGDFTLTTVRHILVMTSDQVSDEEAKAKAEDLMKRARSGEDFAKLADEYSEDPGNTNPDGTKNGGLYENVPAGQWTSAFKEATLSLPLHEVSDPVKTEYGYHVIVVENREEQPFDAVKEQLTYEAANNAWYTFYNEELPKLIQEKHLPQQAS